MKFACFAYIILFVLLSGSFVINNRFKSRKSIISFDDIDFEHVDLVEEASNINTLKSKLNRMPSSREIGKR